MAYGLPRKNTVKTILRGSCYNVQEPWDLALLTKTWYTNLANLKLPFLEEITFGSPIKLTKCKTVKDGLLPSAESIKTEREYEMKRLTKLKSEESTSEEVQLSLRGRAAGFRRPFPPKSQAPQNGVCAVPCIRGDGGPEPYAVASSVSSYEYIVT
nr:uncharacterized protein C4orf36 homolog [Oryctolagus cuniculus]XP_008265861.1 uncharacterized protein C4orf36 homolog [Oryctolagus cuniculus]XP_008265862.1 uncharacterized protein C4orf36 homolog [Oryctolagus cuniculus]XP_051675569.1 uncharacterized protein C4orf36 homolog [Oryctolagus cuniculus]